MNSVESGTQFHNYYVVECGEKRIIRPESEKLVLGSAETSDLVISTPNISEKHCEIVCTGDGWMLNNLSPQGTILVAKRVVQDAAEKLDEKEILRMGGFYVQCNFEIESTEPPLRVLKVFKLMGDGSCYLAEDSRNQPNETIETGDQEITNNSNAEITSENSPSGDMESEINGIINSMASENQQLTEELRVTKEALRKALTDKDDLEAIKALILDQLKTYEEEAGNATNLHELVERELQCSICNEILIDAVTLACSHTFCEYCLSHWKLSNRICPMCRKNIDRECKTRVIDNFIEMIMKKFPNDSQQLRKELLNNRKGQNH